MTNAWKKEAAREAIEKPIEKYTELHAAQGQEFSIEEDLVEEVLKQVQTGKVIVGETGRGVLAVEAKTSDKKVRIETPFLQMVMTRLWEKDFGSRVLRRKTLDDLGGADRIVRTHLDATMDNLPTHDQEIAARIFHYLVTPSGTKIAHTASDLAEYAKLSPTEPTALLEKLSTGEGGRILRPVEAPLDQRMAMRYEIFHDVLAPAILDWRARYEAEKRLEQERVEAGKRLAQERTEAEKRLAEAAKKLAEEKRRKRQLWMGLAGLSLLVFLIAGLMIFAFIQKDVAEKAKVEALIQKNIAFSRELAVRALLQLAADPELCVLLAIEAVKVAPTAEASNALRQGLIKSNIQTEIVMRGHKGAVRSAIFSPNGDLVVTTSEDSTARIWEARTGQSLTEFRKHTGIVNSVAFSRDGKKIVTTSLDSTARIWDADGHELTVLRGHIDSLTSATFSFNGERIVTTSADWTARIWDIFSGEELLSLNDHSNKVLNAIFDSTGKKVITVSVDGGVCILDVTTEPKLSQPPYDFDFDIMGLAYSADGQQMVMASDYGQAYIVEVSTGHKLKVLFPYSDVIQGVAFSSDSKQIVTTGVKSQVRIWEAATGRDLDILYGHTQRVLHAAYSFDGKYIVTASADSTARIHLARIEDLTNLAQTHMQMKGQKLKLAHRQEFLHERQQPLH